MKTMTEQGQTVSADLWAGFRVPLAHSTTAAVYRAVARGEAEAIR